MRATYAGVFGKIRKIFPAKLPRTVVYRRWFPEVEQSLGFSSFPRDFRTGTNISEVPGTASGDPLVKKSIDYFDRFAKIVCWIILFRIRHSYGSLESYLEAPVFGPRQLNPKSWRMNLPWKLVSSLTRTPDGINHLTEFLDRASGLLTYHRHVHRKYKSGEWLR